MTTVSLNAWYMGTVEVTCPIVSGVRCPKESDGLPRLLILKENLTRANPNRPGMGTRRAPANCGLPIPHVKTYSIWTYDKLLTSVLSTSHRLV